MIIDEAHELVSRVTSAASSELSPQLVERVARRALNVLEDDEDAKQLPTSKPLPSSSTANTLRRVE